MKISVRLRSSSIRDTLKGVVASRFVNTDESRRMKDESNSWQTCFRQVLRSLVLAIVGFFAPRWWLSETSLPRLTASAT